MDEEEENKNEKEEEDEFIGREAMRKMMRKIA